MRAPRPIGPFLNRRVNFPALIRSLRQMRGMTQEQSAATRGAQARPGCQTVSFCDERLLTDAELAIDLADRRARLPLWRNTTTICSSLNLLVFIWDPDASVRNSSGARSDRREMIEGDGVQQGGRLRPREA